MTILTAIPAKGLRVLLALLLVKALSPCCSAGEPFLKETLTRAGETITAPLRLNKHSAVWLGGLAAGGLLFYSADGRLRHGFSKNQSNLNDSLASVFEKFGRGSYEIGILGVYGGISCLLKNKEGPRTAVLALESFAAANAAGTLVKYTAGRARPYSNQGKGIFRPYKMKTAYTSFPSGHTTSAFAVASVFARRCSSPWVGVTAYGLATGTALQRVYDDKHWASDVFAGAALGTVVGRWIAAPGRDASSAMLLPVYTPGYAGATAMFSF